MRGGSKRAPAAAKPSSTHKRSGPVHCKPHREHARALALERFGLPGARVWGLTTSAPSPLADARVNGHSGEASDLGTLGAAAATRATDGPGGHAAGQAQSCCLNDFLRASFCAVPRSLQSPFANGYALKAGTSDASPAMGRSLCRDACCPQPVSPFLPLEDVRLHSPPRATPRLCMCVCMYVCVCVCVALNTWSHGLAPISAYRGSSGSPTRKPGGEATVDGAGSMHGGSDSVLVWKDARKGRSGMKVFQIMCECCGFCVNVHTSENEDDGVKNVQVRFENRCPIMIFSQVRVNSN